MATCISISASGAGRKAAVVTPAPPGNSFKAVLARLYTETSTEDKGDGSVSFFASFSNAEAKNADSAFGERDGFRKITFFTSAVSTFAKYQDESLTMYMSVPDCKAPVLFMSARVFRNSWLFLERASVLADGELVLDRVIQSKDKPKKEVFPGGVEETVDFSLTNKQLVDLRKTLSAKKVNVRITGAKGYVSLSTKQANAFKDDLAGTLRMFDTMSNMVAAKAYDQCN